MQAYVKVQCTGPREGEGQPPIQLSNVYVQSARFSPFPMCTRIQRVMAGARSSTSLRRNVPCASFTHIYKTGTPPHTHTHTRTHKHTNTQQQDVGVDSDLKNPNTRIYMTRAAQPWHVDSSDVVGLLCLAEAQVGTAACCV